MGGTEPLPVPGGLVPGGTVPGRVYDGWSRAADAREVHELLCVSDAYAAARHDLPAPVRHLLTSRDLVGQGLVHLRRREGVAVAMFTLGWQPPHAPPKEYPPAVRPAYLQRLAVDPASLGKDALLGAQTLRRAVEVAAALGADAIRAETNPDLGGIVALLTHFGFLPYGPILTEGWMRRVYLQKQLPGSAAVPENGR